MVHLSTDGEATPCEVTCVSDVGPRLLLEINSVDN